MPTDNILIQPIDALAEETYKAAEPGAAIIVVRDGEILFRRGLGIANLELAVPIEPDMVFRIGSITKQFTAVAILMLLEQGRLSLHDSLSKFLPDYPDQHSRITVENLLAHTSGIRSYTDLKEWPSVWRKDFAVHELIDFFKNRPAEFAPGNRWAYNNSGYILLGAIIEKVSGLSYEQFIQKNIFAPLGMNQSYYDHPYRVLPRRVAGYERGPNGYINAEYISMTQPYAAGALASTVDDMAIWDAALYTDALLKSEILQQAFTVHLLPDGSSTACGYGWGITEYEGHLLIEHGGSIHGFQTHAIRMPDDHIFVCILSNNGGSDPGELAFKIAALIIGRPFRPPMHIDLSPEILARYEGLYRTVASEERRIVRAGSGLVAQCGHGARMKLIPCSPDEFFLKDMPHCRLRFVCDANGAVVAVEMRGRCGIPEFAGKIDESMPENV